MPHPDAAVYDEVRYEVDKDEPEFCRSQYEHRCDVFATWEVRGDGERLTWCATRKARWDETKERYGCLRCGRPQTHWLVLPL